MPTLYALGDIDDETLLYVENSLCRDIQQPSRLCGLRLDYTIAEVDLAIHGPAEVPLENAAAVHCSSGLVTILTSLANVNEITIYTSNRYSLRPQRASLPLLIPNTMLSSLRMA